MPDDTKVPMVATATAPVTSGMDMLSDPAMFEQMQRVAKMFAQSQLVPQHLRGKIADCFIALHIAKRLDEDPLMLMQSIYIINGKAGWETKYMIARANKSGLLKGPIRWRSKDEGEDLEVTAFATLAGGGEEISAPASMKMATAENWTKNPKYKSMPEHMLRWRSATMLIRLYMPEIMLGLPSAQELEDGGELIEQADGSYAPEAPQRADFQKPASKHSDKTADDSTGSQEGGDQPEPYELVDCDGKAKPYQQAGRYAKALAKVFDEAATRGVDVLEGMWETNSPTFGRLRSEGRTDLVDDLHAQYGKLRNSFSGAGKPADAQTADPAQDTGPTLDDARTATGRGGEADGPPPGHPASGEMF